MERECDADVHIDPAIDDVGLNDVYGRVGSRFRWGFAR